VFAEARAFANGVCADVFERPDLFRGGQMAAAFFKLFAEAEKGVVEQYILKWGILHLLVLLDRPVDLRVVVNPSALPQYTPETAPRVSVHAQLVTMRYGPSDEPVPPILMNLTDTYVPWQWGAWARFVMGKTLPDYLNQKTPLEVARYLGRSQCARVLADLAQTEDEEMREEAVAARRAAARAAAEEAETQRRDERRQGYQEYARQRELDKFDDEERLLERDLDLAATEARRHRAIALRHGRWIPEYDVRTIPNDPLPVVEPEEPVITAEEVGTLDDLPDEPEGRGEEEDIEEEEEGEVEREEEEVVVVVVVDIPEEEIEMVGEREEEIPTPIGTPSPLPAPEDIVPPEEFGAATQEREWWIDHDAIYVDPDIDVQAETHGARIRSYEGRIEIFRRSLVEDKEEHDLLAAFAEEYTEAALRSVHQQARLLGVARPFPRNPPEGSELALVWEQLRDRNLVFTVHAGTAVDENELEEARQDRLRRYKRYERALREIPVLEARIEEEGRALNEAREEMEQVVEVRSDPAPVEVQWEEREDRMLQSIPEEADVLVAKSRSYICRRTLEAVGITEKDEDPIELLRNKGFWRRELVDEGLLSRLAALSGAKLAYSERGIQPDDYALGSTVDLSGVEDIGADARAFGRLAKLRGLTPATVDAFATIVSAHQTVTRRSRKPVQVYPTGTLGRILRYDRRARKGRKTTGDEWDGDPQVMERYRLKLGRLLGTTIDRAGAPDTHFFLTKKNDGRKPHYLVFILRRARRRDDSQAKLSYAWHTEWGYFDSWVPGDDLPPTVERARQTVERLLTYSTSRRWSQQLGPAPAKDIDNMYYIDGLNEEGEHRDCGVHVCMFLARRLLRLDPNVRQEEMLGFRRVIWLVLKRFADDSE